MLIIGPPRGWPEAYRRTRVAVFLLGRLLRGTLGTRQRRNPLRSGGRSKRGASRSTPERRGVGAALVRRGPQFPDQRPTPALARFARKRGASVGPQASD